jgi:limonene 1,2-monooxygenase
VAPHFQGSLDTLARSNEWCRANGKTIFGPNVAALQKAFTDAGRAAPKEYFERVSGARDMPARDMPARGN